MPFSKKKINKPNVDAQSTSLTNSITIPKLVSEMEKKQYYKFPHFTQEGIKLLKLPPKIRRKLTDIWLDNRHMRSVENMNDLKDYIKNINDKPPTYVLPLESQDGQLYKDINNFVLDELKKWTEINNLVHKSTYGIREYTDGAILENHLDRHDTHILSAIVNCGSINMRRPWYLEIQNRVMAPKNIEFKEGYDVILYESSSLVHGRPTPLEGEIFANLFIHYAPSDWNEKVKKLVL